MTAESKPPLTLNEQEIEVAWAALITIVHNDNKARDAMKPAQWKTARELLNRLTDALEPPEAPARRRRK